MSQNPSAQSKAKSIFLVVDHSKIIVNATSQALQENYPQVEILTALDASSAQSLVEIYHPDLVLLDLNLPDKPNSPTNSEVEIQLLKTKVGINLVKSLMLFNPAPHIAVSSTNVMSLVRVKSLISNYECGFAARDKSISIEEMLNSVDLALRSSISLPPQVRSPDLHPDWKDKWMWIDRWIEMLTLRYEEGLSDQVIAERIGVGDRAVRIYWGKLQEALCIHKEDGLDLKIKIEIAARNIGLID